MTEQGQRPKELMVYAAGREFSFEGADFEITELVDADDAARDFVLEVRKGHRVYTFHGDWVLVQVFT
jgi:hypothetical protein